MAHRKIKAVAMTRGIRDRIYEQLKNMSNAEALAFYREQARLMDAKVARLVKPKRKRVHA